MTVSNGSKDKFNVIKILNAKTLWLLHNIWWLSHDNWWNLP